MINHNSNHSNHIFSQLRHPNIVLFMGACFEPGKMAIVTEYLSKGDLYTIIHDPRYQLSFVTKCKMAKDITSGRLFLFWEK